MSHRFSDDTFLVWTWLGAAFLAYFFTNNVSVALQVGFGTLLVNAIVWWYLKLHRERHAKNDPSRGAVVVWFTGLSGAGKTTIAAKLCQELSRRQVACEHLDGDVIRRFFPKTGYSRQDRDVHIRRVGYLASCLEKFGVCVVATLISPYKESREFVRSICQNYIEVHVSTPIEVCESRDPKGLYARARKGEVTQFTGIDDPYDPPTNPDIAVNTAELSIDQAVNKVLELIQVRRRKKRWWPFP